MTLNEPMENLNNSSILVTGATGSFGQQCVRRLLTEHKPKRVVVFSRDELKQFEMQQRMPEKDYPIRYFIGDVRDADRLRRACSGIDIVIHAAAMKHVTASEYNPTECIATNVDGSKNLIEAAIDCGVQRVLALSTDKAVNPVNLYGATKLCAEKLFVAANNLSGRRKTRFSVVRYGNVAGSRGSVIPLFKRFLLEGRTCLPITHPDMTRFLITLDQGVDFVLGNLPFMAGGEVFIPKLPSFRITDLVDLLGEGLSADVIGIRAGEKLHELMIASEESRNAVDMGDHYVIEPMFTWWNTTAFAERMAKHGKRVPEGFSYASNTNDNWLSSTALRAIAETISAA